MVNKSLLYWSFLTKFYHSVDFETRLARIFPNNIQEFAFTLHCFKDLFLENKNYRLIETLRIILYSYVVLLNNYSLYNELNYNATLYCVHAWFRTRTSVHTRIPRCGSAAKILPSRIPPFLSPWHSQCIRYSYEPVGMVSAPRRVVD